VKQPSAHWIPPSISFFDEPVAPAAYFEEARATYGCGGFEVKCEALDREGYLTDYESVCVFVAGRGYSCAAE
jgi:hypothetical protein